MRSSLLWPLLGLLLWACSEEGGSEKNSDLALLHFDQGRSDLQSAQPILDMAALDQHPTDEEALSEEDTAPLLLDTSLPEPDRVALRLDTSLPEPDLATPSLDSALADLPAPEPDIGRDASPAPDLLSPTPDAAPEPDMVHPEPDTAPPPIDWPERPSGQCTEGRDCESGMCNNSSPGGFCEGCLCAAGHICNFGTCNRECSAEEDCPWGLRCARIPGGDGDMACALISCGEEYSCPEPFICDEGFCRRPHCPCPEPMTCLNGRCAEPEFR